MKGRHAAWGSCAKEPGCRASGQLREVADWEIADWKVTNMAEWLVMAELLSRKAQKATCSMIRLSGQAALQTKGIEIIAGPVNISCAAASSSDLSARLPSDLKSFVFQVDSLIPEVGGTGCASSS